ncbi:tRNA uridine-5-carboxymethylaminomethyl(34) synthesis GTPase MnmE [Terriglobus sp. RCC_193]|uniref:tRNA uridine-5-carboxymethylaminomethyl(34) synthesis GTPase MnmE n=1 Tax=Terriglobus sp. RCC_193 TaxID=3239218 RepID=UPI0035238CFB
MSVAHDFLDETTIVAVATPVGRGGIGVVRLSGNNALSIAQQLLPKISESGPRHAHYGILRDVDGTRIDDAIATYYKAPHSYTGEDVVEIAAHGSPVVLDWLLRRCVALGAMPARAGEFTERAFLRGRLDLTEAEAVRDLIDAQTLEQAKLAAEQMSGSIAAEIRPAKDALLVLIATLEAGIDFAEDDTPTMAADEIIASIRTVQQPLQMLVASFTHGRLMREGLQLAIVGKPNAGKSSLFNRLVEQDRAIVTATPGTTRDVIAERVNLNGIPVELLDTAGIRETADEAERMGVERSRRAIADADAVLLVVDATEDSLTEGDPLRGVLDEATADALEGRALLVVWNKADLCAPSKLPASEDVLLTSAVTGEGMTQLREAILLMAGKQPSAGATLTNLRQRDAVMGALDALERAIYAAATHTPHEMVLLDVYDGLRALDALTGQTTADDVLNRIFSSFCIGK